MKKINEIKLYKIGEVVEILESDFNYKTDATMLCRKIKKLGAYIIYNNIRYIPEDIICYLTIVIRKKEIKFKTKAAINQKLEKIKEMLNVYIEQNKISTNKTTNTKTSKQNTLLQIKEEMQNIKEIIQKDIQNKHEELKNLKKTVQKTKKELQEELQEKNEEIIRLKKEIQNIKEQKEETEEIKRLSFVQELKKTLSIFNNIYDKSNADNENANNKKNITKKI